MKITNSKSKSKSRSKKKCIATEKKSERNAEIKLIQIQVSMCDGAHIEKKEWRRRKKRAIKGQIELEQRVRDRVDAMIILTVLWRQKGKKINN